MLQREKERRKMKANLDKWRIIAETFLTFCSLIGVALRMSGRARVEEVDRRTGRLRHGGRGRDTVRETDRQTEILWDIESPPWCPLNTSLSAN